jgi:hypothetical protein
MFQSRQPSCEPLAYNADSRQNAEEFVVPFSFALASVSDAFLCLHTLASFLIF